MVTAAMLGLNETADLGQPARLAITTTTRDWLDEALDTSHAAMNVGGGIAVETGGRPAK